jgi:phage shock protein C
MAGKRLYRSNTNKMVCGVCSGIAEYFGIDATLVRIGWVILTLFSAGFGGLLAYIVAAVIIPDESRV